MQTVNIHEAKTHLSRLLERVAAGEEVVIAKAGRPVARLVAYGERPEHRRFGRGAGLFEIPEDFDDALPDDVLAAFDRLLVAQTRIEGLTLVTADPRLAAYDVDLRLIRSTVRQPQPRLGSQTVGRQDRRYAAGTSKKNRASSDKAMANLMHYAIKNMREAGTPSGRY